MGDEWQKKQLGDVVELKRGYDLPKRLREEGAIPLISSAGASDFHKTYKVKGPGVVTGRYGTIGQVFYSADDFWPLNTTLYVCDFKGNDPKFIYYFLKTINYQQYSDKAAVPGVNRNHLHLANVVIPVSTKEQKAIAHILGSLDDKIELNRQMNATLEAMAQALFKSWFVDFDPVIDNALAAGNEIPETFQLKAAARQALTNQSGNDKLLTDHIRQQFPSAFEFSETMGWIPEGWKVRALSELINIRHGFAFKGVFFSQIPTENILLTPGNFCIGGGFKEDKLKFYNGPIPEGYVLQENDLLVTMTDLSKAGDTLGYPAFTPKSEGVRYLHNQRLGKVEFLHDGVGKDFIYRCLCSTAYRNEVLSSVTGSTVKHTSPKNILAHQIAFSKGGGEKVFEKNSQKYSAKKHQNNNNIKALIKLRDTLLPKLLSGELRIPDAEKLVQEVL